MILASAVLFGVMVDVRESAVYAYPLEFRPRVAGSLSFVTDFDRSARKHDGMDEGPVLITAGVENITRGETYVLVVDDD